MEVDYGRSFKDEAEGFNPFGILGSKFSKETLLLLSPRRDLN